MSEKRPALAAAAKRGNRRNTLVRLRDVVAYSIDHTDAARDIATLGRLMINVLDEIESCPSAVGSGSSPQGAGVTSLDRFRKEMDKKRKSAVSE